MYRATLSKGIFVFGCYKKTFAHPRYVGSFTIFSFFSGQDKQSFVLKTYGLSVCVTMTLGLFKCMQVGHVNLC